jgi:hypothetical protein
VSAEKDNKVCDKYNKEWSVVIRPAFLRDQPAVQAGFFLLKSPGEGVFFIRAARAGHFICADALCSFVTEVGYHPPIHVPPETLCPPCHHTMETNQTNPDTDTE